MVYELEDAGTALRGWRDLLADMPRQATPVARVGRRDEFGGRPVASIGYVWVGDPDDGRRLLAPYPGFGRPIAQEVRELSYLDLQSGDDDIQGHRGAATARGTTCVRCRMPPSTHSWIGATTPSARVRR